MTIFRPCIDIHQGQVKQIVGGSLNDNGAKTNFVSKHDAAWYAELYREHQLCGGHVISLGQGNQEQALAALKAWPQGLQYGGGVTLENAADYLAAGASHVIVTSWLFEGDMFSWSRLEQLVSEIGKQHLVLDLSCRKVEDSWYIATNRWQTITSTELSVENLQALSEHCAEFLIHAADVEGLQAGIDQRLVSFLGRHSHIPMTYAGGARSIADLRLVSKLSQQRVDLTIGSALDIFGGQGASLTECIEFNKNQ
ncbi:MAG: phosphoribosylformimino-5-aminoimidazole carboxamide ribotide isomerase [Pseudomonadales bacterium]|nr:phosphoribosylformimino-5-aminoimidazole carboxamide ribotide isomerase [Pseudomonadales bacterium]